MSSTNIRQSTVSERFHSLFCSMAILPGLRMQRIGSFTMQTATICQSCFAQMTVLSFPIMNLPILASFFFGIMRKLLILIPLAFILPRYLGVWGIYAAEAISNPVTTLVTFVVFSRYLHKIRVSWATDSCTPVATEDNSMFSYPADSDCLRK